MAAHGWNQFLEKDIVIYYNDGEKVNRKAGILIDVDKSTLFLDTDKGKVIIPRGRIIRVERHLKD